MSRIKFRGRHVLFVLGTFVLAFAARAETYRCVEDGKVIFSDRICGNNAEAINVKPASGDRSVSRSSEEAYSAYSRREPKRTKRIKREASSSAMVGASSAPYPDGGAANIEIAQQQQAKLIKCVTNEYNAWLANQKHPPSIAVQESEMTIAQRLCRHRFPGVTGNR